MEFLLSLSIWSVVYVYFLVIGRKRSPNTARGLLVAHTGFSWVLVAMHCTSIQALGWSITNFDELQLAAKPTPEIPEKIAVTIWMSWTLFSVPALFLTLGLAKGSESARRWLLKIIPILFVISSAEFFRSFRGIDPDTPWLVDAFISTFIVFIPYGTAMYFYTRPKTISAIFSWEKVPELTN